MKPKKVKSIKPVRAWAVVGKETGSLWRSGTTQFHIYEKREEARHWAKHFNEETVIAMTTIIAVKTSPLKARKAKK